MKTSVAEANGYVCPRCGDGLARDLKKRGYVRHKSIPPSGCDYGQTGERDEYPSDAGNASAQKERRS